jgi:hypothetical protein
MNEDQEKDFIYKTENLKLKVIITKPWKLGKRSFPREYLHSETRRVPEW